MRKYQTGIACFILFLFAVSCAQFASQPLEAEIAQGYKEIVSLAFSVRLKHQSGVIDTPIARDLQDLLRKAKRLLDSAKDKKAKSYLDAANELINLVRVTEKKYQ